MSDTRFDKLEDKLDKLKDEIAQLNTTVATGFAVYNKQLEIHIEATNQNRDAIKFTNSEVTRVKEELEPIKDHVKFIKKFGVLAGKVAVFLAGAASLIFAAIEALK